MLWLLPLNVCVQPLCPQEMLEKLGEKQFWAQGLCCPCPKRLSGWPLNVLFKWRRVVGSCGDVTQVHFRCCQRKWERTIGSRYVLDESSVLVTKCLCNMTMRVRVSPMGTFFAPRVYGLPLLGSLKSTKEEKDHFAISGKVTFLSVWRECYWHVCAMP